MRTRLATIGILVLTLVLLGSGCFYVVEPGERGVRVTLGEMDDEFLAPGFGFKLPIVTAIRRVNVQQDTREVSAECFSSDLQQINLRIKVLYRIPEASVVPVLRDYAGNPFEKLILPRVQEATKEVTALKTAADIVKTREQIKVAALDAVARQGRRHPGDRRPGDRGRRPLAGARAGDRGQDGPAAGGREGVFRMQQAKTDAETLIIKATADAESIRIQGEALEKAPKLVELKMVEKWNGVAPQVVGSGSNILLPLNKPGE